MGCINTGLDVAKAVGFPLLFVNDYSGADTAHVFCEWYVNVIINMHKLMINMHELCKSFEGLFLLHPLYSAQKNKKSLGTLTYTGSRLALSN